MTQREESDSGTVFPTLGPPVTEIKMTCGACPAQWEARLADGQFVYVRFRHGRLSIGFSKSDIWDAVDRDRVIWSEDGDRGTMDFDEMLKLTGLRLAEGIEPPDEDEWWEQ
jgi:hypothetical protein